MRPKSCKSAKNQQKISYTTDFAIFTRQNNQILIENCTRGYSSRTRAFQQQCWFFAVTSVTHLSQNTDLLWKNDYSQPLRHRLFSTLFSLFQLSKSKQTLTKPHIPLYFNLLREPLWHLWQQKHKNSCIRVYVRAHEKILAPLISNF